MIRQAGYNTVITVPDADAAWGVLKGGVAVVLLRGDSELLARIRQEPAFGAVPVILFGSPLVVSPEALSDSLEQRGRLRLGPTRFLTRSKASDEDFRRLVMELRQIPLARGADTVTRS